MDGGRCGATRFGVQRILVHIAAEPWHQSPILAGLLHVSVAAACGGFAPQSGALTSSDAQKALFDIGEEEIAVTYTANYTGNAADSAWVIAVPGEIAAVEEGDAELLAQLDSLTAPQVELDPAIGTDEGCGCGASKSDKSGNDLGGRNGDTNEVIVTGSGYAGDYAYTTLSASDAGALITWLDDHGYQTDLLAPAITTYVEGFGTARRPTARSTPSTRASSANRPRSATSTTRPGYWPRAARASAVGGRPPKTPTRRKGRPGMSWASTTRILRSCGGPSCSPRGAPNGACG